MEIQTPSIELFCVVRELNAPIAACYEASYREEAIKFWAPGAKSVVYDHAGAEVAYGPGSARLVTLNTGMALREVIELTDKPNTLGYCIPGFGGVADKLLTNYQGRMYFEQIDSAHTRLTWKGYGQSSGIRLNIARFVLKKLITMMADKLVIYVSQKPDQ